MTTPIKYHKPVLIKYNRMNKITNTSGALEGTAVHTSCVLWRCGGEPGPLKG